MSFFLITEFSCHLASSILLVYNDTMGNSGVKAKTPGVGQPHEMAAIHEEQSCPGSPPNECTENESPISSQQSVAEDPPEMSQNQPQPESSSSQTEAEAGGKCKKSTKKVSLEDYRKSIGIKVRNQKQKKKTEIMVKSRKLKGP